MSIIKVAVPAQSKQKKSWRHELREWLKAFAICFLAGGSTLALAQYGGVDPGDAMGDTMCQFVKIFTGKWLFGAMMCAMAATGIPLLMGAEMTDMVKKVMTIIFIGSVILFSGQILVWVFQKAGAIGCS